MTRALHRLLALAAALAGAGCAARAALPPPTAPFTPTPDAAFRARAPEPWPAIDPAPQVALQLLRLPNGLEVYYAERRDVPLVSLLYVSRAAKELESGVAPGLASFTGHALVDSTYGPDGEVLLGLRVGGARPAVQVSLYGTSIGLQVSSSGWRPALETLARVVQQPAFDPQGVERVRVQQFEQAVDQEFTFAGVLFPLAVRALLGERDPWATGPRERADGVRKQTRQDLVDYHRSRYRPSSSALIVVGDAPAAEIREFARQHFGEWTPRAPGRALGVQSVLGSAPKALSPSKERRVLALLSGGEQCLVLLPQRAVPSNHPDRVALELLQQILSGGFQSRAALALRHSGGLTYGVSASIQGNSERALLLLFTAVDRRALAEGVRRLERELERLRVEPVSEGELAAARSAYLGDASAETNAGLASAVASLYLDGRAAADLPDLAAVAAALGPEDLLRVARQYLDPRGDLVVVGDVTETGSQLEALGDVTYLAVMKDSVARDPVKKRASGDR